jgi:4-amino-4-deoxy-L-arabinose transferase-like glycosyltransferase
MKKNILFFVLVVFLAGFLRFYKLGSVPAGFFNDEAAVGYNAYSLLKTGKDEFGEPWPVFFRSFGEGKLPLYVYQDLPFVAIFGLNELATRFPGALLGTLAVLCLYFLVKESLLLLKVKEKGILEWLPVFSSFYLAIMPWHIHFSRGVFGQESLFWMVLGSFLSIRALRLGKIRWWVFSFLAFSGGLLTYHAAKAFTPLWIGFVLIYLWQKENFRKSLKIGLLGIVLTGTVWLWMTSSTLGQARAKDMSVFSVHSGVSSKLWESIVESQGQSTILTRALHNKVESYGRDILSRYFSHFDPVFLFFEGDVGRPRYKVPNVGLLLVVSLPLFLLGIYKVIEKKYWPFILFLALSPIPASLSFETPSSVRAIFMVAPLAILLGLGTICVWEFLKTKKEITKVAGLGILVFALVYNFSYYQNAYYLHAKYHNSDEWQFGMKNLVKRVTELLPNYERAEITDSIGTPYILFLFYNKYNPSRWQQQANNHIEPDKNFSFIHIRKMDNIDFKDEKCPASKEIKENTLYVCVADTQPGDLKILDTFFWQNGKASYVIGVKK